MNQLTKLTLTVERMQEHTQAPYTDPKVWLRWEAPESDSLNWVSFLLLKDEALDLFEGRVGHLVDGYHHLDTFAELWTFYDLQVPRESAGIMPIKYRRISIPLPVRKIIASKIREALAEFDSRMDPSGKAIEPVEIDLTPNLKQWSEHYGRGKGQLKIESQHEDINIQLDACRGETSFDRSWETITNLALNTTHSADETGIVSIYRESETSFIWSAGRLHGGLINHGSVEAPEWSVHT